MRVNPHPPLPKNILPSSHFLFLATDQYMFPKKKTLDKVSNSLVPGQYNFLFKEWSIRSFHTIPRKN